MNQEKLIVNFWSPAISMNDSFLRLCSAKVFIFPGCENDAEHPLKTINLHYKRIKNHFKFFARLNRFALFPTPTASRFQKNRLNCHKAISLRQPIKVAINLNMALNVFIAKKANFSIRFRCIENISATVHN